MVRAQDHGHARLQRPVPGRSSPPIRRTPKTSGRSKAISAPTRRHPSIAIVCSSPRRSPSWCARTRRAARTSSPAAWTSRSFTASTVALTVSRPATRGDAGGWMLGAQLPCSPARRQAASFVSPASTVTSPRSSRVRNRVVAGLAIGDEVVLDNSSFLAAQTYHRHQVPGPEYTAGTSSAMMTVLRSAAAADAAGAAVHAARLGNGADRQIAEQDDRRRLPARPRGVPMAGRLVSRTGDRAPRRRGRDRSGSGTSTTPCTATTTAGVPRPIGRLHRWLEAALRQLAAWVEDGVEPPPTTVDQIVDGQVVVPPTAEERRGVSPSRAHRERSSRASRFGWVSRHRAHRGGCCRTAA